jgi:hypothetical protein
MKHYTPQHLPRLTLNGLGWSDLWLGVVILVLSLIMLLAFAYARACSPRHALDSTNNAPALVAAAPREAPR